MADNGGRASKLFKWFSVPAFAASLLAGCVDTPHASREIDCAKAGFALDGDRDFTLCYQVTTTAPESNGGPGDAVTISAGEGLDAVAPALFRVLRVDPEPDAFVPDVNLKSFLELYVVRGRIELTPAESLEDVDVGTLQTALFDSTDPLFCYGFLRRRTGHSPAEAVHQMGGLLCAASDTPSRRALVEFLSALDY